MTARAVDLIVKGGRVVTASDVVDASVRSRRAHRRVGARGIPAPADRVIDATGKLVFPG